MTRVINQYDILLVNLDPTVGHEIQKTRPCVVISPDEMNHGIKTAIIAPMTTNSHNYLTRISLTFEKNDGWVVLDQIRTINKKRIIKKLGKLKKSDILNIKCALNEMLIE
ncbi:type II toxin-antitoxin system PemK/MazF family toxin [Thiospirochaeta perfilievii]|uniref:mRNA interferase n=1 Tax=Thiospirochaeta perfilievii TaxID=252967 RepID=A0A5C1QBD4_9SPIO|nr:type II toxin-antitoxin system PemK/MazF family toxin [Thiospirochaeta perfilievii]QEN04360.1 type II toxin-antitoxin system PemK/MazF family toxin [Thiospirochaeta perfilievii]